LDWSQAGRLTRHDRIKTAQLIQAVYKKDLSGIRRSVKALARGDSMDTPTRRRKFRNLVLSVMRSPEFAQRTLMKRTFKLMGRLAFEGFVFPAELMLFLKSFFTLEGVIYDLWPAFEMDTEIRKYVTSLMTREIPRRVGGFFLPLADRPENYASLISNSELQSFIVHRCAGAVNSVARSLAGVFIDGFRRTE
jgi:ubiquinone biosynthesis protein